MPFFHPDTRQYTVYLYNTGMEVKHEFRLRTDWE